MIPIYGVGYEFSFDVSVMILIWIRRQISILSKIITETSYLKLTIKTHESHYKYNLLASAVESAEQL